MERFAALGALILAAIPALASCSSPGGDAESHLVDQLHESAVSAEVPVEQLAPDSSWQLLAIVCPYEPTDALAARLDVDPGGLPDLSQVDTKQALVAVGSDGETQSWVFGRDRVDLCANGDWPTIQRDDSATLAFSYESDSGVWFATPGTTT